MSKFAIVNRQSVFVFFSFFFLASYGGGSSSEEQNPLQPQFITWGGIKGPLAYASVELYALDTRYDQLYQPDQPIATATTNTYAEITDLPVPRDISAPYVLVIDGTNAIDRNTGEAPVIKKLVTIITQESLGAKQPAFATPYTTLAYHMLRLRLKHSGDGLLATYYNDLSLSNAALERNDASINFEWSKGSPDNLVNSNGFSVRWTGLIEPEHSEEYTFYTTTDDGVRLWVDGQLIIDHWRGQSATMRAGSISLIAEKKYSIAMEYYENTGDAIAKLSWSSASQPKTVVPQKNLYTVFDGSSPGTNESLVNNLMEFNQDIIQAIGFGVSPDTNVFTTPPIIINSTTSIGQQQLTVHYRTAIEALSALLHETSLNTQPNVEPDMLLQRLALDLYSDGIIDNSADGLLIGGIDTGILSKDPLTVDIPNIQYAVGDILVLMEEERALIGDSSGVVFLTDEMLVNLQPALLETNAPASNSTTNMLDTLILAGSMLTSPTNSSPPVSSSAAGVKFYHDFENDVPHVYTYEDLNAHWRQTKGETGPIKSAAWSQDLVEIVKDPANSGRGNVMQILYPGGSYSSNYQVGWRTPVGKHEELYFAYDIMFHNDFEFVKGAKLPGLAGGTAPTGGKSTDGTDGWSGRMQWRPNGAVVNYLYSVDNPYKNGQDFNWDDGVDGQVHFIPGQWHRLEMRYKMNSCSDSTTCTVVKDGILQAWFDGKLVMNRKLRYRTVSTLQVDTLFFNTFYGGSTLEWAPINDQHAYFDNFVVSTNPITH